jgi:hypothetical protein
MTVHELYKKPLSPDEIAKLQKAKVPLWCSWQDNEIYIYSKYWFEQDSILQLAIAKYLGLEVDSE